MKYSVIIPAKDEAKFIRSAILSLASQTVERGDFEIIVVDNGSTDGTATVALDADADRVIHESTPSPNSARDRGAVEASGTYLAFLDADCIAPYNWLQAIGERLEQGADLVSGPYDYQMGWLKDALVQIVYLAGVLVVTRVLKILVGFNVCPVMGGNFACTRMHYARIEPFPQIPFWGDDTAISLSSERHGRVVFDFQLQVRSSARRFIQAGFVRTSTLYIYHYFRVALRPRAWLEEQNPQIEL